MPDKPYRVLQSTCNDSNMSLSLLPNTAHGELPVTNTTIAHGRANALKYTYSTKAALARTTCPLYSTTNFQGMAKKYEGMNNTPLKHLDITNWRPKNLYRARALNLHRPAGLKIWDREY